MMDRSDIVYLVTETITQDEYGIQQTSTEEKKVYCQVDSVTGSEWFEGGRNGLNPELRITLFKYDYSNESVLKYNSIYYSVYRTYFASNDTIELYVERRMGSDPTPVEPTPDGENDG